MDIFVIPNTDKLIMWDTAVPGATENQAGSQWNWFVVYQYDHFGG